MTDDDSIKNIKTGAVIVGELIKAAGDNPEVKDAAKELGRAALTISKTVNNALLPLAAVNFACDKAKKYFQERFQDELQAKARAIPPDQLVEPKASIAGPALQALAFAHEEQQLKEMYLSLLKTAMDKRVASAAHPAFVEIIRQLTAEEAGILSMVLRASGGLPMAQVRLQSNNNSWRTKYNHLMQLHDDEGNGPPAVLESLPAYIDNWIRLGLVTVEYGTFLTGDGATTGAGAYDWVETRFEFLKYKCEETPVHKLVFERGICEPTSFGTLFAQAVGVMELDDILHRVRN